MAYLFAHFTGEQKEGEQVYFSLSRDGLYWKDLNRSRPVLRWEQGEGGVRDPFVVREEKTGKYFLIATDLRIEAGKGWEAAQYHGSRDLVVWESSDLVHWSEPRACCVGVPEAGCVWAPEAIYDRGKESFLVFWASMVKREGEAEAKQRIYASYTRDFCRFTEPELYLERENHVIDTTIVFDGRHYIRISKDETTKTLRMDASESLQKDSFREIRSETLDGLWGVEGPECYRLPDGRWCLIADRFAEGKGYLPLLTEDLMSGSFEIPEEGAYDLGASRKRHGGVIEITEEEACRLEAAFGTQNPVLPGQYADPDIAVFDGIFYLYPTTDGYENWSGTTFSVFSSRDGIHYEKAADLLDVTTEAVPWATGSAWAPCIAQKDGRYYYYFCAKNRDGVSCIGAASADRPEGPFLAEPEPLLTMELMEECGITMSQTIDPSIYMEGETAWILFGNGAPAIARLTADMLHIEKASLRNLEGAYDFREAITVLKRDGIYHFTWSCDDTGSEDYHVNYGTSDSLYGPICYQYPILEKDPARGILGTGHHAIVRLPGKDEYRIAYHRFVTPLGTYTEGLGFHRETCIAPLTFGGDGKMQPVQMVD